MPTAFAMSRMDVPLNPFAAKRSTDTSRILSLLGDEPVIDRSSMDGRWSHAALSLRAELLAKEKNDQFRYYEKTYALELSIDRSICKYRTIDLMSTKKAQQLHFS